MAADPNIEGVEFSDEDILAVLGAGRTKGVYTGALSEFANSGAKMREVNLADPLFATKTVANVKQGFENAKNAKSAPKEWERIVVKKISKEGQDDKLFLVNLNLLSPQHASTAGAAPAGE